MVSSRILAQLNDWNLTDNPVLMHFFGYKKFGFRFAIGLLCLLTAAACQEINRPEKPDNLIPKDKMADILYDITLLNAAKSYSPKMIAESNIDYREYVYKKHGIDSLQLAKSSSWYSHRIDTYLAIYNQVEERLIEQKRIWKDSLDREKAVLDSLAKIRRETKPNTKDSLPDKKPEKIKDSLAGN